MADDVQPILMTQVDWKSLTEILQSTFGFSPTRVLDENSIPVDRPSAFLCALGYPPNTPSETLRSGRHEGQLFEHAVYGFAVKIDLKYISKILATGLSVHEMHDDDACVAIVTGNMLQWYGAIVSMCRSTTPKPLRVAFNKVMSYLERAGYSEVWCEYDKVHSVDKSFTLKGRS